MAVVVQTFFIYVCIFWGVVTSQINDTYEIGTYRFDINMQIRVNYSFSSNSALNDIDEIFIIEEMEDYFIDTLDVNELDVYIELMSNLQSIVKTFLDIDIELHTNSEEDLHSILLYINTDEFKIDLQSMYHRIMRYLCKDI